jgi:HlyD family secretion protein
MVKRAWMLAVLLVVAVAVSGCDIVAQEMGSPAGGEAAAAAPEDPGSGESDTLVEAEQASGGGGPVSITAEAVVEPEQWSALGIKSSGEVVEVLVEEGDSVEEGQLLVRLDQTDYILAIAEAESGLAAAKAELEEKRAGPRPEDVAAAEAQLEASLGGLAQAAAQRDDVAGGPAGAELAAARAELAQAYADYNVAVKQHELTLTCYKEENDDGEKELKCPALGPIEERARANIGVAESKIAAALAKINLLSSGADRELLRAANAVVASSAAQREAMQAQLDLLLAGPTKEELGAYEAKVMQAEVGLESAKAALAYTEVRAPFAGTVTSVMVEVGNSMRPGQVAAVLATLGGLQARTTDLTELDIVHVSVGQPVIVTADGVPGQEFKGVVSEIALRGVESRGQVVYDVLVDLIDIDEAPLRWGMTAWVEFGSS